MLNNGIVLRTCDKPVNLNLSILDLWLFIYWPLYIGPCVNNGFWCSSSIL